MGSPPPTGAPGAARSGALLAGRYRLDHPLATGGMARVWEARDEVLGRPVAVKVLLEHLVEDDSFVSRFRAEALAAARLTHPSVVSVYDTCSAPGLEAIVMELVDGETLRQRLDTGRLDPPEAARIGARIAEALAVAHRAGIVHRDIKPANVLLSDTGRVVVTDFGIAKAAEGADLTTGGQMLGTAKYLAPEQVEGQPVDGRTDVYALGIVLYEAVCGRVPFAADTEAGTALARLHADPTPPRVIRPDLDADLARVIERCIARAPADRWPDATSLGRSLNAIALGRTLPPDPSPRPATPAPALAKPAGPAPEPGTRSWRGPEDDPSRSWRAPEPAAPPARPAPAAAPRPSPPPVRPAPPAPRAPVPHGPVAGPPAPHRPRRRLGPTLALVAVLTVSILVIAALGWQILGPGSTETLTPTAATAFDPPPGDGVERDDETPRAIDGDAATAWRTERYNNNPVIADAVGKPGVGLVLELGEARRAERLHITSPSRGWTAQAYVFDAVPTGPFVDEEDPVDEQSGIDGDASFSLGGREGAVVVLWITRVSEDERTVEVAEARVEVAG
ncbi:serine/threonine protein kinase [Iamia sp. SCSIO 61187]|uniref:serine/threonine-protein kinase n=1 Tax=Iamia sp. SCSIO 61187 TaxID=2722752 RepID=UPI001C62B958|nr:serine/threonine-protein kinase [Iamia sp. SCSIO 61187]QYG95296.1 serine/threonine protein kinase [Iamia sp. SCSIO 61187]